MQIVGNEERVCAAGATALWGAEFPVLVPGALIERTRTRALIDLVRIKLGFPPEVFVRAVYPVIEGYAGFVQLLPARESARHARPGGRLGHGLELALRALDHRRGQILPRGAAPEVIGELAHRWTYAVFVTALLCRVRTMTAGLRILMRVQGRESEMWDPLAGSMLAAGASAYRVRLVEREVVPDDLYRTLPLRAFEEWVPQSVRVWLAEDAALMPELRASLVRDSGAPRSVLSELVLGAALGRGRTTPCRQPGITAQPTRTAVPGSTEPGSAADAEHIEREEREDPIDDEPMRKAPPAPSPPLCMATPTARVGGLPTASPAAPASGGERTAVNERFVEWLKSGISDGTIRINEPRALVHGVDEGMLLVSPRVFREFAKYLVGSGEGEAEGGPFPSDVDPTKWIQRQVLRAGWHLQAAGGLNILAYQVMRADRAVARLSGVVIRDPVRFIDPAPPVNPILVRVPEAQERG
jgi:hypothetical protein